MAYCKIGCNEWCSQAAKILLQIKVASLKSKGEKISEEDQKKLLTKLTERYDKQTSPYYAASRLWVDSDN